MDHSGPSTHRCGECGNAIYNAAPAKLSKKTLNSPAAIAVLCSDMGDLLVEHFDLLALNIRLGLIKRTTIAIGGGWACAVNPREVVRQALLDDASVVAFVHNHPSGDCLPSPEDDRLTKQLKDAFKLMGIKVIDHVIVAKGSHYSYSETGKLGAL
jgi:DNA repair protein RadC